MFTAPPSIGARLTLIRREYGLDQETFADLLTVETEQYAAMEADERDPDDAMLDRMRGNFNISPHWVRTGTGDKSTLGDRPNTKSISDLPPEDDAFRRALPDVYTLYKDHQELKKDRPPNCPACEVVNRLR